MSNFDTCFTQVIVAEGGYSDNKNDAGGQTNWGITIAVARANGFSGDMKDLKQSDAQLIYKSQYWDTIKLDNISIFSTNVASELFDIGVNMGVGTAGKFLQRSLNLFNLSGSIFADMKVDGVIGPMTVAALGSFLQKRGVVGEGVLLKSIRAMRAMRYVEIAEAEQKNETFIYGWFLNRVH